MGEEGNTATPERTEDDLHDACTIKGVLVYIGNNEEGDRLTGEKVLHERNRPLFERFDHDLTFGQ